MLKTTCILSIELKHACCPLRTHCLLSCDRCCRLYRNCVGCCCSHHSWGTQEKRSKDECVLQIIGNALPAVDEIGLLVREKTRIVTDDTVMRKINSSDALIQQRDPQLHFRKTILEMSTETRLFFLDTL